MRPVVPLTIGPLALVDSDRPRHPRRSVPVGRALYLVDLENLLGDPRAANPAGVRECLDRYLVLAEWTSGDSVAVAAHPSLVRAFAFDWPVAHNAHAVRGTDSADEMLLSLAPPSIVARHARLVVGSGDHAFVGVVQAAHDLGVPATVVAPPESVSRRLRKLAARIVTFEVAPGDPSVALAVAS